MGTGSHPLSAQAFRRRESVVVQQKQTSIRKIMTNQSQEDMKNACHSAAEWALKSPSVGNRQKWLRQQISEFLTDPSVIDYYAARYSMEYRYADVQSPFLAEILKTYDQEVES
jgi:hypothetical protein